MRRRHDTLLRQYLDARGLGSSLERTFRDAYWLASVGNSLSGALYYHLAVATDVEGQAWATGHLLRSAGSLVGFGHAADIHIATQAEQVVLNSSAQQLVHSPCGE